MLRDIPFFWRKRCWQSWVLLPLSLIFRALVLLRRQLYRLGVIASYRAPVPVIVVGNVTVGGNGKTPLVIALVNALQEKGWKVGVISRGYGGNRRKPVLVNEKSDVRTVGDEPLLIHQKTRAPVSVYYHRQRAIENLLMHFPETELIISDDGLQHYSLQYDCALLAIAADFSLGNGFCLPAGALREPLPPFATIDAIITTGKMSTALPISAPQFVTTFKNNQFYRSNGERISIETLKENPLYVVTAIARPERFLNRLHALGISPVISKIFADHAMLHESMLTFAADGLILMTTKDQVKTQNWSAFWQEKIIVLSDELTIDEELISLILSCATRTRK